MYEEEEIKFKAPVLSDLSAPAALPSQVPNHLKYVIEKDISNGQELFPVRVWNSLSRVPAPQFEYIKTLQLFPKYQRSPVVCDCIDGCDERCICMSTPFTDKFCEIPYDDQTGRLKKFPKKWEHTHRVLWECSENCPCGQECPSRSAQLGLRFQLEVFMTSKKGWGVRALQEIPKGSFVAEYAGVVASIKEEGTEEGEKWTDNNWYSFDIMSEQGPTNFFIDATTKGNVARFFNHSCEPNMMAFHVFYDDNNPVLGMHICFFSTCDIKEREELTFDYGEDYWKAKLERGLGCDCGATKCNYRLAKKSKKFKKPKLDNIPDITHTLDITIPNMVVYNL
ncbi:histone-lysine N-methyltransferase SETDB2-like [Paramacrobiotus metropolitanus]|uniref:histone-lysine N-methyltransferase SETDB2-like n=1 Tax=Paramacrobiotus metropolitanus TaxID=2943436 RepID=UPI0024464F3B|nr:histone-lysine N-methyltransferase SETDB2-like [Paramacrobiotus metropolitanus]XP_055328854.1 histone-lysine N-methyltransferase SETDB2-like [Paramacrobiotus metropolitanus]XP_055328855.1 histone-lysine N-methyltransferase SETDB2-like [Paramacrobiotus metropolitanus]XP_055328856.1 histone-lysine N-methyltransferase SETDB2-like [Paramacrobiotus metropolitanus]